LSPSLSLSRRRSCARYTLGPSHFSCFFYPI
jgi:hypothetical protein